MLLPISSLLLRLIIYVVSLQVKGLDVDALVISHIQVNQAQKQRRRTYRAHGRINRKFLNLYLLEHNLSYPVTCFDRIHIDFASQLTCHLPATLS